MWGEIFKNAQVDEDLVAKALPGVVNWGRWQWECWIMLLSFVLRPVHERKGCDTFGMHLGPEPRPKPPRWPHFGLTLRKAHRHDQIDSPPPGARPPRGANREGGSLQNTEEPGTSRCYDVRWPCDPTNGTIGGIHQGRPLPILARCRVAASSGTPPGNPPGDSERRECP